MNLRKDAIRGMALLAGGILILLTPWVPAARAETENVKVVERKPDESNPMYEIIKVEGGLTFRAPKDMTFVEQNGVIAPISTEEYCLRKFEGVGEQIEALKRRIDALEGNVGTVPDKKDQTSL